MNLPIKFGKKTKMVMNEQLNTYQKKGIIECERYPAYWTLDMVTAEALKSNYIDLGVDLAIVTTGQFRSLLVPLVH